MQLAHRQILNIHVCANVTVDNLQNAKMVRSTRIQISNQSLL